MTPPACWSMFETDAADARSQVLEVRDLDLARARGVVACRSKTFRMTASRSATGSPVASSRLRVCEGAQLGVDDQQVGAGVARAWSPIRSAIPLRMSVRGSGRCSSCISRADDAIALALDQADDLCELGRAAAPAVPATAGPTGRSRRCRRTRRCAGALRGAVQCATIASQRPSSASGTSGCSSMGFE